MKVDRIYVNMLISSSRDLALLLGTGAPFPSWDDAAEMKNIALEEGPGKNIEKMEGIASRVGRPRRRRLPDDSALRGFSWTECYLPDGWFEKRMTTTTSTLSCRQ